jgi:hypothetical protein
MSNITAPQTLCKQPSEKRKFEMRFGNLLATGETLTSIDSVTAEKVGKGASDLTFSGEVIETDNKVTFWIEDGTHGSRYRVEVTVQTSGGATLEGDGILKVSDT